MHTLFDEKPATMMWCLNMLKRKAMPHCFRLYCGIAFVSIEPNVVFKTKE